MGKIKRWKTNIKRNRSDVAKLNKKGTVVWEGGVSSIPKRLKKKGYTYKTVKVHDIFGKINYVTVRKEKK